MVGTQTFPVRKGLRKLPIGGRQKIDHPEGVIPILRTIILPAYNESGYIAQMVGRSIHAGEMRPDPFEVIVVNNASTDDTASIVEAIAAKDHRVRLISHPENRLYAASCLTGTRAAKGDRIFILDSDGQHPPEDIWKFDAKLDEGYDIVFGWRRQRQETFMRLAMSRFLWIHSWWHVGFNLHDVNCGIRGFNRSFADRLKIKHRVNFVNPEFFVRAKLGGLRIGEVEVVQEKRKAGISSHELGRLWRIFRTVNRYLGELSEELKKGNGK
jgi:glycosyltransferase involved in cell wall biosynthesis